VAAEERPNVLFVAIDDLNDWVGCFGGNPQVKTPNLDRFFASGGMVMYDAHAPATVCCPSRSALLTGVHCHRTGVYVPQKYFDMYPLDEVVLPKTLAGDLDDIVDARGRPIHRPHASWLRAEKYGRHKEAVQAYLATITFVDDCMGVLLDGLAKSKYADNTIVMIWGDHGWHLGEKQKYGKTQLWQESCRVPLMVKVPGVTPPNKRCMGVVNLIDMYPTLVELCGLPANPKNDGRSFAQLLHNHDMQWNRPTLTTSNRGNHRIYDGRYSYSIYRGAEELYDNQQDPMQWTNLAHNAEYADVIARLKTYLPSTNEPESPRNLESR
jgi:arylsulfatase A-like enzyme